MDKIWIVLKSEFIRRVRSKWFFIGTLLAPLFLIAISVLPALLVEIASDTEERSIVVVDETKVLGAELDAYLGDQYALEVSSETVETLRQEVLDGKYNGYLFIPASLLEGEGEASFYSAEGSGLSGGSRLERALTGALEDYRLKEYDVSEEVLDILDTSVSVNTVKITAEGDEADSAAFYSIMGYIMGFIIYGAMFLYGSYVIQGVLEEKTTRVIEVMVSSVKPFQMLMGKVLGIGAVGLVQMMVWSMIMLGAVLFAGDIVSSFADPAQLNLAETASQEEVLEAMNFSIPPIKASVFVWFVLFFLGGYLLFSSMFAAVSSMVDQPQDAQGLLMPIYLLIIIPIMLLFLFIEAPNSAAAIGLSMVPFFSPILMVVRVAVTEVPFWQVGGAFVLLIATFIGAMWLSSRIYRVGILMYGKKPKIKDMIQWVRYQ